MTESAYMSMTDYIDSHPTPGPSDVVERFITGMEMARTEAEGNQLFVPSTIGGDLIASLAASGDDTHGAVAVTPAVGVIGLHILRGLPDKATLTCINTEAAYQSGAKEAFRAAGFAPSRSRFLTARPLDVMSRLAPGSYGLVVADVEPSELSAVIEAAWPLLAPRATMVLTGSLLDGTLGDETRRDRVTELARAAYVDVDKLAETNDAVVTRLPLDGGLTLVTKR